MKTLMKEIVVHYLKKEGFIEKKGYFFRKNHATTDVLRIWYLPSKPGTSPSGFAINTYHNPQLSPEGDVRSSHTTLPTKYFYFDEVQALRDKDNLKQKPVATLTSYLAMIETDFQKEVAQQALDFLKNEALPWLKKQEKTNS
jgi:hypothetical protein